MSNITEYTGIIALDTVLNAKIEKASVFNISIRPAVAIYGELYIDTLDLVLLIGNALDNAIEATEKIEDSLKKYIHLSIKLQENYLLIEVKNSVLEKVLIQNQFITTTKSDDGLHGFGLENMRVLTEKYHGTMLLECDDNFFQVRIVLENERV